MQPVPLALQVLKVQTLTLRDLRAPRVCKDRLGQLAQLVLRHLSQVQPGPQDQLVTLVRHQMLQDLPVLQVPLVQQVQLVQRVLLQDLPVQLALQVVQVLLQDLLVLQAQRVQLARLL